MSSRLELLSRPPPTRTLPRFASFFQRAIDNLAALPGANAAGAATVPLLSLRNQRLFTLRDPAIPSALAANATVLGDYFRAVGIHLRRGRLFDSRDRQGSGPVLVINETMARQYFPGKDAVGQQLKQGTRQSPNPWCTIIGVVSDARTTNWRTTSAPNSMNRIPNSRTQRSAPASDNRWCWR